MTLKRREFNKKILAGLSGSLLFSQCRKAIPSISILGGGIAGLNAAHLLKKAGIIAPIYEASSRVGGRIITGQGIVAEGITTELGGEFIDSSHKELLDLCNEFDLPLLDMLSPSENALVKTDFYVDGEHRTISEILDGMKYYPQLLDDLKAVDNYVEKRYYELDKYSIDEYLHSINMTGWLANLLKTGFTSELGLDTDVQNCITMLSMISVDIEQQKFEIYGDSDERYKVVGGNERIIKNLSHVVDNQIYTNHVVEKITQRSNKYDITFSHGKIVSSDIIIITLPFTALRNVQLEVEMPPMKRKCIQELDYGTQSKLFFGFKERFWRQQNYTGYVLSDKIQNGWDSSQMQANNRGNGSYTLFMGGEKGSNLTVKQADKYLNELDKIYYGAKENFLTSNYYNWSLNPFVRGAYSCYKVGQMNTIAGWEDKPIKNIYFAGEHCSEHFGGFMYGAVETSIKAVGSILSKLR